jgi:hypothetical protein
VTRVTLRGLTPPETAALARATAGPDVAIEESLARRLHRDTNGNPFYLTAVLQHLHETGALTSPTHGADDAAEPLVSTTMGVRLPPTVWDVLRARIARLGPAAEQVLAISAVIGQEFELDVLATVSGIDEDHALNLLEAAERAALLTEDLTGHGRFRFVHSLVQHTLYEGLGRTRRAHTHARIADALEALHGDHPGERIGELARHALAGIRPVTAARASRHAQAAAERALAGAAPEEAIRWYTAALTALDRTPDERARLSCQIGLGTAQRQAGDPACRATLLAAGRTAQDLGENDLLVQAAVSLCGSELYSGVFQGDPDTTAVLQAALDVAVTDGQRARLAAELPFHPEFPQRRALADQAVRTARDSGDLSALLGALIRHDPALLVPDGIGLRVQRLQEAFDLATTTADPVARFAAAYGLALARLEYADIDGVGDLLAATQHDALDIREPTMLWMSGILEASLTTLWGDLETAERQGDDALALGQRAGCPDAAAVHGAHLTVIRWHQGRLAERLPLFRAATAALPDIPTIPAGCAIAEAVAGDRERAGQMLRTAAEQGFAFPYTPARLPALCAWADVAVELAEPAPAAILYDQLRPWDRAFATLAPDPWHATVLSLAGLAALLGDLDRAHQHFSDALTIHQRVRMPFGIALTELQWGQLHLAQGHPTAGQHLAHAVELASRHGYHDLRSRARDALASTTPS